MPGLNRKGPNGEGAMTGRRLGQCSPENKGKSVEEILAQRVNNENLPKAEQTTSGNGMGRGQLFGRGLGLRGRVGGRGFGRGLGK